ncbi:MAG TPA: hypothetical protein VN458_06315 [Solirubrobacterales bacterium]|nr:hypothetical protein [Solirubrobacterales bacterium]
MDEVEVELCFVAPLRVAEHELASRSLEVAGAPGNVEPMVAWTEAANHADVTESADFSVEVELDLALELLIRFGSTPTPFPTDPVVAVLGIEQLGLEAKPVRIQLSFEHCEVMIERCRGRDREQTGSERREDSSDDQLVDVPPDRPTL